MSEPTPELPAPIGAEPSVPLAADRAAAWDAAFERGDKPAPEPVEAAAPEVEVRPEADVLAEHGFDRGELEQFIADTPGVQHLFEPAQSDSELLRQATLARSLQENALHRTAREQSLLQEAIDLYEAGEQEPSELANQLMSLAPGAGAEFVRHWREAETEWDQYEAEPITAAEWLEQRRVEAMSAQMVADSQAANEAAQAALEAQERSVKEIEEVRGRHRDFDEHIPQILQLLPSLNGDLELAYGAAKELVQAEADARSVAATQADVLYGKRAVRQRAWSDGLTGVDDPARGSVPTDFYKRAYTDEVASSTRQNFYNAHRVVPTTDAEVQAQAAAIARRQREARTGWNEQVGAVRATGKTLKQLNDEARSGWTDSGKPKNIPTRAA